MKDEFGLKAAFDLVQAEKPLLDQTSTSVLKNMRRRQPAFLSGLKNMAAAAACMVVLFFSGFGVYSFFQPVSVVSIDINPSIELGVNALDYVVTVQGFNPDGEKLLDSLSLRFLSSEDAVEKIVSSEPIARLINQNEELFITVVGQNQDSVTSLCEKLESCTEEANTQCHTTTPESVADAHQCGLSYGKYLAYLDALKDNERLNPEDVQDMTMRELKAITRTMGHHHGAADHTTANTEPTLVPETTVPTESTSGTTASHHGHGKGKHNKHH